MGRIYTVEFSIAAHTAQVDYLELLTAAEKPVSIIGWEFGQLTEVGDAQEEFLHLVLKRVTGAPTSGTGGGTAVITPLFPNDTAASFSVETGNTTKLTGGTSVTMKRYAWNVRTNSVYFPPPEGRIVVAGATRLVLEETTTPADSITGPVGYMLVEELV